MFTSEHQIEIPCIDLLSWTFGNQAYNQDRLIWIDAYDNGNSISARDAKRNVRKLVAGLRKHRLEPEDTVCVHSFNNIWYPLVYLAVIGAGGRFVGSNPAYKPFELKHLFTQSKTKYLIVQPNLLSSIWSTATGSGILPSNIFLFDALDQTIPGSIPCSSWKVLLQNEEEDWHCFNDEQRARKTTATLLWTSGTSGPPKAAVMSHYAIMAQAVLVSYTAEHVPYKIKRLISLPFFHSFVLPFHLIALRRGEPTYVMSRFNAEDYACFIDRYQITTVPLVPPMALTLFSPPLLNRYSFSSLREILSGGAPLRGGVQSELAKSLQPAARFYQVWGMSELGWVTVFRYPEHDEPGSVGKLLPNSKARLIDEHGNEITEELRSGEILVKNSGTMSGYLNNRTATDESYMNGWFKTGDIGYCHGGRWYIVDRAKDLIKVRGWQVSPAELEACLLTHPMVKDAAVIGVDAGSGRGEVPLAYVVLDPIRSSHSSSEYEIQAYVRQQLAGYKALDGGVKFVEAIPRTVSGKILRRVLREKVPGEVQIESPAAVPGACGLKVGNQIGEELTTELLGVGS